MENTIKYFINTSNSGLLLSDLPTGFGKSYTAIKIIYDYVTKNNPKKVFFLTTLLKNLPVEDLRRFYIANSHEEQFHKDVLVIKSNSDFVSENLLKLKIPDKYQNESYKTLYKTLEILQNSKHNISKDYKGYLNKSIREELEPNFRRYIREIIKSEMPDDISKRKELIRNHKNYKWIGELYPTVFMSDYKVFFLTVNKFLVKNTTLIEPSYDFITHSITKDSIIFIDEFDATKDTIQQVIIDKALANQTDYIDLFVQIHHTLKLHDFPISLMSSYRRNINEHSRYSFESLVREAEDIYEKFSLMFNYKTNDECIDRKQNFLFNDGSYHTMLRDKKQYIRVTPKKAEKIVQIYFENQYDYDRNKTKEDIVLYSLIRSINSFLHKFQICIFNWATYYKKDVDDNRTYQQDKFTLENAMKTIYNEFSLSKSQISLLMSDLNGTTFTINDKHKLIPDLSFYNRGFQYFNFVDKDEHLTRTTFNFVQVSYTPEKVLYYLCKKSSVIGISATASITTVTGNYDLKYLQKKLGNDYHLVSDKVYKKIKSDLEKLWEPYYNGEINVSINVVDKDTTHLDLRKNLKNIFHHRDYVEKYFHLILTKSDGKDYNWKRYCNVLKVLKDFVVNHDIKSFLCLNMVLPELKRDIFDLELFNNALDDLIIEAELSSEDKEKLSILVLKSENFAEIKNNLVEKLSNEERIFIFSTYKTVGAGQNLQYKISNNSNFVLLSHQTNERDSRLHNKDLDGIFLGDVTNVLVNTLGSKNFSNSDMLKFFFQIESLYQNSEINFKTLKNLIKHGFKSYLGSNERAFRIVSKIKNTESISNQVTRDILQAVGRLCRTFVKNPNIYIYITQDNINKINPNCLKDKIICPEMDFILREKKKNLDSIPVLNESVLYEAERISIGCKNYIMGMLSKKWTAESVNLWKEMRRTTLQFPTASKFEANNNEIIEKFYIKDISKKSHYYYVQYNDFSDISLDFSEDKTNTLLDKNEYISTVSMEDARLEELLAYPGLEEHFHENNWATTFKRNDLIMSPILFNNIYKGALGEVSGKFIIEKELGISLKEINDFDKFEFFDYEIIDGVYIDFKHWKQNYLVDREDTKDKIINKLESINGKCVFIINIYSESTFPNQVQSDGKIIEISYLINNQGKLNIEALELIKKVVINNAK